jgi:hypothetical protein
VSSGSGGAAPERWTSFKTTTGSTYSTIYNRDRQGYNDYWLRFIDPDTPDNTPLSVKVRRQEYEEAFDKTHENYGLQTLAQARAEEYHWFGYRIHEFTEYHKDWRINNRHSTDPNNNDGILGSMPLDIHFVIALCAPNAVLFHDGWHSANGRTHPEGQYMMYLATRELYDFLGKPNNIGIRMYDIDHAQPARESYDLVDFSNYFFNANHGTTYSRQSSGGYPVTTLEDFTDRIADNDGETRNVCTWYNPTLREDYLRLNWKKPNRTVPFNGEVGPEARSIADNVRAYFAAHPDELVAPDGSAVMIDYPKSLVPEGSDD